MWEHVHRLRVHRAEAAASSTTRSRASVAGWHDVHNPLRPHLHDHVEQLRVATPRLQSSYADTLLSRFLWSRLFFNSHSQIPYTGADSNRCSGQSNAVFRSSSRLMRCAISCTRRFTSSLERLVMARISFSLVNFGKRICHPMFNSATFSPQKG